MSLAIILPLVQSPWVAPSLALELPQLLSEAAVARTAGDWEEVVRNLESAHDLEPENTDILVQLGGAYRVLQRVSDSEAAYRSALAIDEGSPDALLGLAGIALQQGVDEDASRLANQVLAHFPDNVDALLLKGRLDFRNGDFEDAETALRSARRLSPDYVDVLIVLGDVLYTRGSIDEAQATYREAEQRDPDSSVVAARLGRDFSPVELEPARAEEALASSTPVAETAELPGPELSDPELTDPELADPELAEPELTESERAAAETADRIRRLLSDATEARAAGDWETASRKLEEAHDLAPDNVDILVLLGGVYGAQQRWDNAASAFSAALDIDPQSPDARLGMARLTSRSGARDEALAVVDDVLTRYPDNVDALLLKGRLSLARGELQTAEDALRKAVSLAPDYLDLWIALGDTLYVRQDFAEAREAYQRAKQLAPKSETVRAKLARSFKPEELKIRGAVSEAEPGGVAPVAEESSKPKWRVDAEFSYSELTAPRPPWREFSGQVTYYSDIGLTYHARVENNERNNRHDTYLQVGIDASLSESLSAYAALGGTPNANFRPEWQLLSGGTVRVLKGKDVIGPSLLTLDTKWSQYSAGDVTTLSPGIEQYFFSGRVWVNARLSNTLNETGQWLRGWNVRANWLARENLRLFAGIGEDPETVNNRTYITKAYSAGMVWAVADNTELRLNFLHEDRIDSYIRNSVTLGVSRKF
jgi:YaiO family outer membrane protein